MDLNYLLMWFVGASSLLSIYEIHRRKGQLYWPLLIPLGLLFVLLSVAPEFAGITSFICWLLVLYIPRQAHAGFQKQIQQRRWDRAAQHAAFYAALRYDSDWSKIARFLQSPSARLDSSQLNQLLLSLHSVPLQAVALLMAFEDAKFELVLSVLKSKPQLLEDPLGFQIALKSLGEQGQAASMVLLFQQNQSFVNAQYSSQEKIELQLAVKAYSGDIEGTRALLERSGLDSTPSKFWLMTAMTYAARPEYRQEALTFIESLEHSLPQELLQRRILRWQSGVPALLDNQRAELENLPPPAEVRESSFRPVITYLLIGMISFGFVIQALLDATYYPGFSFELGALVPALVIEYDQWWRLGSCIFLHAGLLHLATNMFGLYILGPFLERTLGRLRYFIGFFLFGIGSSLFVVLLTQFNILEQALLIGASGGVLGLVGGSATALIALSKHSANPQIKDQLRWIVIILVVQTIFDLSTPQVSFPAHFGGVVSGFVLTFILMPRRT